MANFLYNKGREGFLAGDIDWDGDNIAVALTNDTYNPADTSAETNYDEIAANVIKSSHETPLYISGKQVTDGVANGAPITIPDVPTSNTVGGVVIFQYQADLTTARLIAFIDTDSGGNINLPTNGGDITVTWDTGANKIFKL